jgi:hypothetical protein
MALMRPQDEQAFEDAARTIGVWILVRRTKPAALAYVGLAGYVPKPINCKAKTADADQGAHRVAGLVTSPKVHPRAFNAAKLADTERLWDDFAREHLRPGSPFTLEMNVPSRHYGCVKLNGKFIHADYDLYDIILPDQAFRNLAAVEQLLGQAHRRGPKFFEVQRFINGRIGVEMIQHGGSAQYEDHSDQSIDLFGPGGEKVTLLNELTVRAWYQERFGGRPTLGHD